MRFDVTRIYYGEASGTAELCVTYNGGENVPPTIDATFFENNYGKDSRVSLFSITQIPVMAC